MLIMNLYLHFLYIYTLHRENEEGIKHISKQLFENKNRQSQLINKEKKKFILTNIR